MMAAAKSPSMAGKNERQIVIGMGIAVAKRAAIKDCGVIQERSLAVGGRPKLSKKVGEQLDVEAVNLGHLLDELRMAAMMCQRMMRIGHADLGIRADAAFTAQHHRRHASQVRLKRDDLQIEHQLDVIRVLKGNTGRLFHRRYERVFLRALNAFSTSRMPVRYSSIFRQSEGPNVEARRCVLSRQRSRMLFR